MNARRPLGFVGTCLESARQTATRLARHRVWWYALGVAGVLALAAMSLSARADERVTVPTLFCTLAWWLHGTVLMPWLTLWLGVQVVHGSLEDRTVQYLFLRPVGRVPLLLGRFLAVAGAGALLAVGGTLALYLGIAARADREDAEACWPLALAFVRALAAGSVAYAGAAVLFAAVFRRPLVWAAFFVVGLQQLTANLPVAAGMRQLTITDPMRRHLFDAIEPDPRLAELLWPAEPLFPLDEVGEPFVDLAWFTAVCLGLACLAWRWFEYDSRPRD